MLRPFQAALLPGFALLVGCATASTPAPSASAAPATAPPAAPAAAVPAAATPVVLATVGTETITVDDFQREMALRGGRTPGQFATVEQRRALLDEMVRQRAVVAAARASGADREPEFRAAVDRMLVAQYLRGHLDPKVNALDATPEEIAAFYESHAQELATPARIRAAWIFVEVSPKAGPEQVERAKQRIEEAREAAAKLPPETAGFGALAQQFSDDSSTRYTGGELGWLYLEQAETYRLGADVVRGAFALPSPGALGPVTRHERGFYFLKLVAREDSKPTPIEKMRAGIRSRILTEKREAERERFYDELLSGTAVSIDAARLAAIQPLSPPAGAEAPPALPTP